jgi:hypothetical protein
VAEWSKGGGTVELTKEVESGGDRFRKRGGSLQQK